MPTVEASLPSSTNSPLLHCCVAGNRINLMWTREGRATSYICSPVPTPTIRGMRAIQLKSARLSDFWRPACNNPHGEDESVQAMFGRYGFNLQVELIQTWIEWIPCCHSFPRWFNSIFINSLSFFLVRLAHNQQLFAASFSETDRCCFFLNRNNKGMSALSSTKAV
jgi:hypothetical protein